VPHTLVRKKLWVRFTSRTVEAFNEKGKRVACHMRGASNRRHTTLPDHMPSAHRRYADWTPERVMRQATKIGPSTEALVEIIMRGKPHPEQGFRACIVLRASSTRRHRKARQNAWGQAPRSGLCPGNRHRRAFLHLRQLHPQKQS